MAVGRTGRPAQNPREIEPVPARAIAYGSLTSPPRLRGSGRRPEGAFGGEQCVDASDPLRPFGALPPLRGGRGKAQCDGPAAGAAPEPIILTVTGRRLLRAGLDCRCPPRWQSAPGGVRMDKS